MVSSFLDKTGLAYLWGKITALVSGVPVESGTGVGSVQSKQFVFDHDDDGEESTFVQAATGDASFAVGAGTTASGMYSHAEGLFTTAYGNRSHAEGDTTVARGNNSHVEGEYTIARGDNQHVSGKYNIEDMDEEYAEIVGNGESTSARSNARTLDWDGNAWYAGVVSSNAYPNDIVSDDDALTTTEAVHQILDEEVPVETGTNIGASATYAGAVQTKSFTSEGHTFHQYAGAVGANAFGMECQAGAAGSFAEGYGTEAIGVYAHAEGQGTHATGQQSHAEGIGSTADGRSSHAEGNNTTANSSGAHSEGSSTVADGVASHAEGTDTKAQGYYSHSEGEDTYAIGEAAHTEGWRTVAQTYAHSEGKGSTATLTMTSDPNGYNTIYTCASIPQTIRRGMYIKYYDGQGIDAFIPITNVDRTNNKITVLNNTLGTLSNTTVTVYLSSAYGQGSHIEGSGCAAYGDFAHAEGSSTRADGINAHAEGYLSEANNSQAHSEGHGTIANAIAQHVEGKFNIADTTSAHIVGNGSNNNNRSNAHTLDWNGNAWYAGTVSAGTVANPAPVTNANDLATKAYVDANAGGGDSPVESGTGVGSVQTKEFLDGSTTRTQVAYGVGSMAEGAGTYAVGAYSHAEGYCDQSSGEITITAQINSSAYSPVYSVASLPNYFNVGACILGTYQNVPVGRRVTAINTSTLQITLDGKLDNYNSYTYSYVRKGAIGPYSHIEGRGNIALGNSAHAEGSSSAYGDMSHAEGDSTIAKGSASHAEGSATKAQNQYSHAEGYGTKALADGAHIEGAYGFATGKYSHVEGWDDFWYNTISFQSLVSGTTYKVSGSIPNSLHVGCVLALSYDAVEPYKVTAIDTINRTITLDKNLPNTTSTYYYFSLVASGQGSHAENFSSAVGDYSHAEGRYCAAIGSYSHAEGSGTIANTTAQHVEGKYNVADTSNQYAHITGVGSSNSSRLNGFTVDWNGNGAFAGSLTIADQTGSVTLTAAQLRSLLALI